MTVAFDKKPGERIEMRMTAVVLMYYGPQAERADLVQKLKAATPICPYACFQAEFVDMPMVRMYDHAGNYAEWDRDGLGEGVKR